MLISCRRQHLSAHKSLLDDLSLQYNGLISWHSANVGEVKGERTSQRRIVLTTWNLPHEAAKIGINPLWVSRTFRINGISSS